MSIEDKGKYYNWIVGQIKDLKYMHDFKSWLQDALVNNYLKNPQTFDQAEFDHSFEWAVADVFGGGCELETY